MTPPARRQQAPRRLSHLDRRGEPRMVDVSSKPATKRQASAQARVRLPPACRSALRSGGTTAKGNVLQIARLAGIMAAKRTHDLIPLCHQIPLDGVDLHLALRGDVLTIDAVVRCTAKTGVEMEALVAVSVAALTVYDMLKALSHEIVIERIELVTKSGGRRGVIDRRRSIAREAPDA
jgi:cyclic pyranopterin phosphate synthase